MKQLTFAVAVEFAVEKLKTKGSFSIYDVTLFLRNEVNTASIGFTDRGIERVGSLQTYRVTHQDVRRVFEDLLSNQTVDLEVDYSNGYRTFSEPVKPLVSNGLAGYTPPNHPPAVSIGKVLTPPQPTDGSLKSRVELYINSFPTGTEVTMKQIQSRFKGVVKTCAEYADICLSLGYIINANNPISKRVVVVRQ